MSAEPTTLPGWRRVAEGEKALPDCVLLVPTYRRPREIVALLSRLADLADAPGEVVVIDGSPEEDSERAVAEWAHRRALPFDLAVVRSPAGLTRQRNVGLDASAAPFVFFLDDDCLPEPGYFSAIRRVFAADAEGSVGAVAGTISNETGGTIGLRWRLRRALRLVAKVEPGRLAPTATSVPWSLSPAFHGERVVDMVPGGASAWRREVFSTERFSRFFDGYAQGEDLEMSLRVRRSWRLLWSGDARVAHLHAEQGRPDPRRKGRMEVRNRYFIWKRHLPDVPAGERLRFWLDIGYVLACDLGYALAGRGVDPLRHAAGVVAGAWGCLTDPPRYEEPPARAEYRIDWKAPGPRPSP